MRINKRIVLYCLLGALFLGVASGAALVSHTVTMYSGACEKLNGFPGLLQSAGFVPRGECHMVEGKCSDPVHNGCTVDGKKGHCVRQVTNAGAICVCVKDRISR